VSTFLENALSCIARGWYVHPLKPGDKIPVSKHGKNDATLDEAQVRECWTLNSTCNVGISCGPSGLLVLDADHGFKDGEGFQAWRERNNIPVTYSVRTGRRPEFAVQMYFSGSAKDGKFELDGVTGEIKSLGGLVMAAGNIHPDSKERYYVLVDAPLAPAPLDLVERIRVRKQTDAALGGELITENRNMAMISILGKMRNVGLTDDLLRDYAIRTNEQRMRPPLDEEELERLIQNACKFPLPEPVGEVVLGGSKTEPPKEPVDWRTRYLTFERVRDAKPVEFLIEGFLALDSITAIAAPVGQRKSLVALNVAHALCTGEPLFDYFKVVKQPSRVVYLCPEMGLSSFSMRLKQIGLDSYVGKTLFCQTMDEDSIKLTDLDEELPGAVVIIDTLTRFVEGDQNSSDDMSRFAKVIFSLKRSGATILLLHHSIKGSNNGSLTLDSAMRGSTELAAFVTSCWATRLLDTDEPYQSPSRLANVKQRDFESKPFDVKSGSDCRLHIIGEPGTVTEIKSKTNADAEAVLAAILKESPKLGINKLQEALRAAGHKKGAKWVTKARAAILGTGVTLSS
jgi:hypothetical protein